MKCYKHQKSDAIEVCKSCQKGVCPECLTLVDDSVVCKETCQEGVASVNYMMIRGKRIDEQKNLTQS